MPEKQQKQTESIRLFKNDSNDKKVDKPSMKGGASKVKVALKYVKTPAPATTLVFPINAG